VGDRKPAKRRHQVLNSKTCRPVAILKSLVQSGETVHRTPNAQDFKTITHNNVAA